MNDTIIEQVVTKKINVKKQLPSVLLLVGIILIGLFSLLLLGCLGCILIAVLFLIAYYMIIPKFHTEIEYVLFNQELEISMIYSKATRKSKAMLNLLEAKCIAPSGTEALDYYRPAKTYDYSSGRESAATYQIIINNHNTLYCYIIEPNEEMAKELRRILRSTYQSY